MIRFNARNSPLARRMHLFSAFEIDLVLDVGAHEGGFGVELRESGYSGRIVSFEPVKASYTALAEQSRADKAWTVQRVGLGAESGEATILIPENTQCSSLLPPLDRHTELYPQSVPVTSELVPVARLDDVFANYCASDDRVFLKIDTQGYELHVLRGAEDSLGAISGVQVELSLVPLYEGNPPYYDVMAFLEQRGLVLMSVQPVIVDPATGQLLQIDALFFRAHL